MAAIINVAHLEQVVDKSQDYTSLNLTKYDQEFLCLW